MTIVLAGLFFISAVGMIWSGHSAYNEKLGKHGSPGVGLGAYLVSGDFFSALFENWESEFLQMSAYVMLTAMLLQRGLAESRDPITPTGPMTNSRPPHVTATRSGHYFIPSLGIPLALLFVVSFALHWWASFAAANAETLRHVGEVHSLGGYLMNAQM